MILVGNQRGGARDLASHLMKDENDHVTLHELRGFIADDLHGAFAEAEAMSKGTRCRQFLFSMSFNPPETERVDISVFKSAINEAEQRLGLNNQPRAIVFHEKEGRRHAHAVWSRIKADEMKAVPLPFTKTKMQDLARDLYREHGWRMPDGLADKTKRDPKNFTLEEWQECKRRGVDTKTIKGAIQDAWSISDSPAALTHALEERGLTLAKGDKRKAVVLDHNGKPYNLAKYAGVKVKDVKARLGDTALPSLMQAHHKIASGIIPAMDRMKTGLDDQSKKAKAEHDRQKQALIAKQREQRAKQAQMLEQRHWQEVKDRQARFRPGLGGLWDKLRGEHARIRRENEQDALKAMQRDREKRDELIFRQIEERRKLTIERIQTQMRLAKQKQEIAQDRQRYEAMRAPAAKPDFNRSAQPQAPPEQAAKQKAETKPTPQRPTQTVAVQKPAATRSNVPDGQQTPDNNRADRLRAFKEKRQSGQAQNPTRKRSGPNFSR